MWRTLFFLLPLFSSKLHALYRCLLASLGSQRHVPFKPVFLPYSYPYSATTIHAIGNFYEISSAKNSLPNKGHSDLIYHEGTMKHAGDTAEHVSFHQRNRLKKERLKSKGCARFARHGGQHRRSVVT